MPWVNLPPGNRGFRMEDGTPYRDKAGGRVFVEDRHVGAIDAMDGNGTAGLLHASNREYGVTGAPGRVCPSCAFRAYAWTTQCPRCGTATEAEG